MAASCGKDNTPLPAGPPTNLALTVTVSTDNSGTVQFKATATNAVSYDFDLGNGVFRSVSDGNLTYRYTASGSYDINVIAKSAGGQTASLRRTITVAVARSLIWADEFDSPERSIIKGSNSRECLGRRI